MALEGIATRTCGESPVAILALYGEVTSETVLDLERTIDSLMCDFTQVVVDFQHTVYVSSAGWRSLIERCRQGRQPIRVAGMQASVRDVYDLLGLNYVLSAHETVADALAAFAAQGRPADTRPVAVGARRDPA